MIQNLAAETIKITDRGKFYFMNKGEYESIRKHIGSVDWNLLLNNKTVAGCWNKITEMLLKLGDRFIPSKISGLALNRDALFQQQF